MTAWLIQYADLISGACGLSASIVLGWPALSAVRGKTYWERHQQLESQQGTDPENQEALRKIGRHVDAQQLGGARAAAAFNLAGHILLAASFVFLLIAGLNRIGVL